MKLKIKEIEEGRKTGQFSAATHFFKSKKNIDKSEVFKILRRLPKGILT